VDTSDLDAEAKQAESEARDLRAKIKGYGVIDVTPVDLPDVEAFRDELAKVRADYGQRMNHHESLMRTIQNQYLASVREIDSNNNEAKGREKDRDVCFRAIATDEQLIVEAQDRIRANREWLAMNPPLPVSEPLQQPVFPNPPEPPDTSELESKISQGEADKVRYEAYQAALKRLEAKTTDEKALADLEAKQRDIKKKKIAKLAAIDTGGIKDLSFDEDGNFVFENTQAAMLSTSQVLRLSSALSSLYPAGFGLELIDRAESLGKSIFTFIERAEREDKSILATIVGEQPAEIPEHVGVWIVEQGEVKKPGYVWCSKNGGKRVPAAKCLKCGDSEGCKDRKVV
jgi:hypothetical protein